ncbi:ABC transporter permease [Nitratireductor aquimarinus]|uniref:ABC transporter permease n=1 Tax=Nitratireductor TaxID=245876 RepID=UPI0019D3B844|nr:MULTISPECIES: ABC transporter permease [Nitratireductor]MBN7778243.1 ABC transporter permease [Nitratireductor pacificus]MBN7782565.1 ABC transporter permease [Nitratireductor pacificus]MBN7791372.1 ABC transporter permease [Nitratireductor aquimarinus]MBY6100452.1 ABC transporter permease [Nitratireductor aquimarinus]MCA1261359.1 ABC transporter permease [Nitratireductor aquimarinus]
MEGVWTLLSFGPEGWGDNIAKGVLLTVTLALATLPLGLAIGFFVALGKRSNDKALRLAANIYTTIFRGLPELLTLFLVFYGAQIGLQKLVHLFNPDANIEINAFVAGMVALGAVFSSYASEAFLAAFRAIPDGQYEGGHAIGLSNGQTMRLVILPQLIRLALPGLSNLWLILLKDTALVSVIGLTDILRQTGIAARVTKEAFLFYGIACLLYLVLAMLSSIALGAIERRTKRHGVQR